MVGDTYLQSAIRRFRFYKELAEKTFTQLSNQDFHFKPEEESNSIAIIIQHMSGNMISRWTNFLTEDGEKSWRTRDDEFEIHDHSKEKLIEIWNKGWSCFFQAIESLEGNDLLKTISIRQESLSVLDAINRQLAHYPYHVGQIVYIGKLIRGNNWKNLSIEKKKNRSPM